MNGEITEWQEIGARPIRPDAPSGDSARYDPDYERLQTEINKLEGFSAQSINWKEVVNLGKGIIGNKSKDLLVACYLCRGLFEDKGYTGLLSGLSCINGMVNTFWETLYPEAKRMRARINAVIWLSEKVGPVVSKKQPQGGERDIVNACAHEIEELEKFLYEKMGGESPGLRELRVPVKEHLEILNSSSITPASTAASTEVKIVTEPVGGAQVMISEIQSMDDVSRALQDAGEVLRRAASFAQSHDPTISWPYSISRQIIWLEMEAAPSHTDGETRIPSPPAHLPESYQTLIEQGAWKDLLTQVESQVQEYPFWLDLHRLSSMALSNLGTSYSKARGAVNSEIHTLLSRVPELMDLRFSDGVPFADDETRYWVETEVRSSKGNIPSEGLGESVSGQERGEGSVIAVRDEAYKLLNDGQVKEAIGLLQQEISAATSHRIRFLIQLELARLCIKAGHIKAAISHLEALDRQIRRYSLEEWEPELSIEVLQTLWSSLNLLLKESDAASTDILPQVDSLYKRLCQLDILKAIDMTDKKKGRWSKL